MTLVVVKVNDQLCRGVIATNFAHSFCGSALVKAIKPTINDLVNAPKQATSDGTPIEFLGNAMVQLELGPWQSDGQMPLLVAWDCPADILIGEDLITEISKKFPVKFEFYKNAVNIGGTRVSMLDPLASEEKFISVVVKDPRTDEDIGLETWKKGNKEVMEPGGLVKRRVEVIGGSSSSNSGGGGGGIEEAKMEEAENKVVEEQQKVEGVQEEPEVLLLANPTKSEGVHPHCEEHSNLLMAQEAQEQEQCECDGKGETLFGNVEIEEVIGGPEMAQILSTAADVPETAGGGMSEGNDGCRGVQIVDEIAGDAAAAVDNSSAGNDGVDDCCSNIGVAAVQQQQDDEEEQDCVEV